MSKAHYSKLLNLDENYLNVFRTMRNMPKNTDAKVLYQIYLDEQKEQQEIVAKLQDMYYWLIDRFAINDFGRYILEYDIYKHSVSIHAMFAKQFNVGNKLKGQDWVIKMKKIIALFDEYQKKLAFSRLNTVQTDKITAIIGRKEIVELLEDNDNNMLFNSFALVSITDPGSQPIKDGGLFGASLHLQFHDLDTPAKGYTIISDDDASLIRSFILANRDKKFVINCEYGESRSAAIGCAVETLLRDKILYPRREHVVSHVRLHPRYKVNEFIYKQIVRRDD